MSNSRNGKAKLGELLPRKWLVLTLMKPSVIDPRDDDLVCDLCSTERTVKRSLFRIWRQQEDLPNAALLPEHMCFSHIT